MLVFNDLGYVRQSAVRLQNVNPADIRTSQILDSGLLKTFISPLSEGRITARREIAIPNASIRTIRGKIRSVRFSAAQIAELSANTHDATDEVEQRRRSYITIASRCASNIYLERKKKGR